MRQERRLLILVNLLLWLALGLLHTAEAQTMPSYLSRDPEYWWRLYDTEHKRAEGLEQAGRTAINGLQDALRVANDTIASQQRTMKRMGDRIEDTDRKLSQATKDKEAAIADLDRVRGKTWVGRQVRLVRDQLAVVGATALTYAGFKLLF